MSQNFISVEKYFQEAAKQVLPSGVKLLDSDGRFFHLMPSSDATHYRDVFAGWIVQRNYAESKKHLGSQVLVSGRDIFDKQPTVEWAKTKLAEALSRMVEFEDGGYLPNNGGL